MKLGVFVPIGQYNLQHQEILSKFAKGCSQHDEVECYDLYKGYKPCDVVVTFGIPKIAYYGNYAIKRGQAIKDILEAHQNNNHIVIEKGYVKRYVDGKNLDEYLAVGWGGLNGRADFCNKDSPSDRWDKLDINLKPWKVNVNGPIILCGQVPWDSSVQHLDYYKWCTDMINLLKNKTSRLIYFRSHPAAERKRPGCTRFPDIQHISSNIVLSKVIENAWTVITYNSNVGVDATIEGIPNFAFDEGSMVWDMVNRDIDDLENPKIPNRRQWANNIAYSQWTLQEMTSGETWKHLRKKLQ